MQQIKQQINSGLSEWDTLINSLSRSCPGGCCGVDPVNYGDYLRFRDQLKAELQTAMRFLLAKGSFRPAAAAALDRQPRAGSKMDVLLSAAPAEAPKGSQLFAVVANVACWHFSDMPDQPDDVR
jgi:hypothetical protein